MPKFQQFNLGNPFRIEYALIPHLMGELTDVLVKKLLQFDSYIRMLRVADKYNFVKFEVVRMVTMKRVISWDVTPFSLLPACLLLAQLTLT